MAFQVAALALAFMAPSVQALPSLPANFGSARVPLPAVIPKRGFTVEKSSSWLSVASTGIMVPDWSPEDLFASSPVILPLHSTSSSVSLFSNKVVVSYSPSPLHSHWKRSGAGQSRDLARREAKLQLPRQASLPLPLAHLASSSPVPDQSVARFVKRHRKRNKRAAKAEVEANAHAFGKVDASASADVSTGSTISTTITWYSGQDLKNPYCDRKSKWTPTDESLIVAVTQVWSRRPACGDFVEVGLKTDADAEVTKSVIVRVVDLCAGCKPNIAHADLSKAAFSRLLDLDVGVQSGLLMRKVAPPSDWDEALYGPRVL